MAAALLKRRDLTSDGVEKEQCVDSPNLVR